jgi:hypothetical protein
MKNTLLLAGLLLPALAYSQKPPPLGNITVSDMVAPISSNSYIQQPVFDFGVPLYKSYPLMIKTGIRYEGLILNNEKSIGSTSFHALTLPLFINYSFSKTTSLTLIGLATVSSDFKRSPDAQDILYTAGIRLGFRPSDKLRYGVTLTYISNYSGKFLIPLPDIDWTISKKLSLSAVLPARASLKYKLTEAQSLGITSGYAGGMYRLNATQNPQYLHLQQYSGGLLYDVKLGHQWKLNLIAGHTFMQRLETFDMNQKVSFDNFGKLNDRTPTVSYRQNAFVFQGSISFAF